MAGESADKFFSVEPGDPVFEKRLESLRKRCSGKSEPKLVKALVKAAGLHPFPWVGWLEFSELTGFLGWWVGVSVSSLIDP